MNYTTDKTYKDYLHSIEETFNDLKKKVESDAESSKEDTENFIKTQWQALQEKKFELSAYLKEKFGADSDEVLEDKVNEYFHYLKKKGYEFSNN